MLFLVVVDGCADTRRFQLKIRKRHFDISDSAASAAPSPSSTHHAPSFVPLLTHQTQILRAAGDNFRDTVKKLITHNTAHTGGGSIWQRTTQFVKLKDGCGDAALGAGDVWLGGNIVNFAPKPNECIAVKFVAGEFPIRLAVHV